MVHRLLSLNLWCESYSQNIHKDTLLVPLGSLAARLQEPLSCDWEILLEARPDHPGHCQEDLRREGRGDLSFVQKTAGCGAQGCSRPLSRGCLSSGFPGECSGRGVGVCACLAWVFSRNPLRPSPSFPLGVFCAFCAPCGGCDVGAGGGGVYASDVIAWLQGWERDEKG